MRTVGLIVALLAVGCGETTSTPATSAAPFSAAAPAPTTWTSVASWSGNGIKHTETFTTTGREWRIQWATSREAMPGTSLLQIYVYDADGGMVTLATNHMGIGQDVSYVRAAPGRYYLTINSGNVNWAITVEEPR